MNFSKKRSVIFIFEFSKKHLGVFLRFFQKGCKNEFFQKEVGDFHLRVFKKGFRSFFAFFPKRV